MFREVKTTLPTLGAQGFRLFRRRALNLVYSSANLTLSFGTVHRRE